MVWLCLLHKIGPAGGGATGTSKVTVETGRNAVVAETWVDSRIVKITFHRKNKMATYASYKKVQNDSLADGTLTNSDIWTRTGKQLRSTMDLQ